MIVFASRTGNVRDIVGRLGDLPTMEITESPIVINEPYFLATYTDNLGQAPQIVKDFLNHSEVNRDNLKGVVASGNTNFGNTHYCGSAVEISRWTGVPIIRMIDLRGNQDDIATIVSSYKTMIIEGESI